MSNFRANLSPHPFGDFFKNILGEKGLINYIMIIRWQEILKIGIYIHRRVNAGRRVKI